MAAKRHERFHGRYEASGRRCERPGCGEEGEFRAPGSRAPSFEGPGDWRWFCLDHVREFNAGYDWFEGMSAEEILDAQSPIAGWGGWSRGSRAFSAVGGVDAPPRWADFDDPLDAIGARARRMRCSREGEAAAQHRFSAEERRALDVMGLAGDADRTVLRRRYSELVRRYHPDRNGGDRSHEGRLQQVVEAYQLLRRAAAFA